MIANLIPYTMEAGEKFPEPAGGYKKSWIDYSPTD